MPHRKMDKEEERKVIEAIKRGAETVKEIREQIHYKLSPQTISLICQYSEKIKKDGNRGLRYDYHKEAIWVLDTFSAKKKRKGIK